jgi:hypothetical protein
MRIRFLMCGHIDTCRCYHAYDACALFFQRSKSCTYSIEAGRACFHAHIHKIDHACEWERRQSFCNTGCPEAPLPYANGGGRKATVAKMDTCASLRTEPDPAERITVEKQASRTVDALSRVRACKGITYTSFPCFASAECATAQLFFYELPWRPCRTPSFLSIFWE